VGIADRDGGKAEDRGSSVIVPLSEITQRECTCIFT